MRIGFIGTGHIAAPMVRFLARKRHTVAITRRNTALSAQLAAETGARIGTAQEVLDQSDAVFLCLRPEAATDALAPLRFQAGQKIVSVMANVTRATLASLCDPATQFVQTIPLGFLENGDCPLAAHGDTELLSDLFAPENHVVPVASEAALNAHFAICAMVPGLVDLMTTGAGWLGRRTGAQDAAEAYTTQLVAGFLAALPEGNGQMAQARDALATDGTLSRQMTEGLHAGGAHTALEQSLDAIGLRLGITE